MPAIWDLDPKEKLAVALAGCALACFILSAVFNYLRRK